MSFRAIAYAAVVVLLVSPAPRGASPQPSAPPDRLTSYVDPFIGTGGHGHTFPGPSLPFGMIQPGPDTRLTGWDSSSGYHYSDNRIVGFSHTHLSGTGIPDYGDILLMPTTGEARLSNGLDGTPGYSSSFSHATEEAEPGYYAVTLNDYGIRAELTSTLRAGLHRYQFPAGRPAHVVLDLAHRDEVIDSSINVVADLEVTGHRRSRAGRRTSVCTSRFDSRVRCCRWRTTSTARPLFDCGDNGGQLLVKVGISAVSIDGARRNLSAELPALGLRRRAAVGQRRVGARARPHSRRRRHARPARRVLHGALSRDADAQCLHGRRRAVSRPRSRRPSGRGFTYYSVFSLWDTFRALHPLLTLIDRARTADFVKTMVRQYQEGGRLPVWELAANETDTMIGYHAVPVIADAILKGIEGFEHDAGARGDDPQRRRGSRGAGVVPAAAASSTARRRAKACRGRSSTPTTTGASR